MDKTRTNVVPTDKAENNIVLSARHIPFNVINSSINNTYTATTLSKEEIVETHKICSILFCLPPKDDCDLLHMY